MWVPHLSLPPHPAPGFHWGSADPPAQAQPARCPPGPQQPLHPREGLPAPGAQLTEEQRRSISETK